MTTAAHDEGDDADRQVSMLVRLPADLHVALKAIARRERRSLNAQTTLALADYVQEQEQQQQQQQRRRGPRGQS